MASKLHNSAPSGPQGLKFISNFLGNKIDFRTPSGEGALYAS